MARDYLTRLLRFDARSLGLFRIAFGITLLFDLFHRWDWIRAFYSNDGVLPNHNHLFQLKESGQAWSIYHSFSSVDEAFFAFLITLAVYTCFTLGWKTRAAHAVSLACLIGLSARNTLAEGPGNSVAIALLFVTLFMPLGARLSVDSLSHSFEAFDEHQPDDLNDRRRPVPQETSPSLASLSALLVLGLILGGAATQQTGKTWQDGSALYYALHVDSWTSGIGVAVREQIGMLSAWTKALRYAELAVVPLALVPVFRRVTGPLAAMTLLFVGLSIGLLFTLGLYGWSLAAAALLLIPEETWGAMKKSRPITLLYDDSCGVCLWCARLLKRLDLRGNVTFQANSDTAHLPEGVSAKMVERSMVAVDADGSVHEDAMAVSQVVRTLPLLGGIGWLLSLPGVRSIVRWLYLKIAVNRLDISVALGFGACGIPQPESAEANSETTATSPAARTWRGLTALVTSSGALLVLVCVWAQTEAKNTLPINVGLGGRATLVSLATWSRVLAPWGLWSPDPPLANQGMVVVAKTRGEYVVDVLTGYPPDEKLENPRLARRGALWATYTANIAKEAYAPFRKEFRRYLTKGGYAIDTKIPNNYIRELVVYWVSVPTPSPGSPPGERAEPTKVEIFNRRGRAGGAARPKIPRVRPNKK